MMNTLGIEAGYIMLVDLKVWRNARLIGCKPVNHSSWGIDDIVPDSAVFIFEAKKTTASNL